MNTDDSTIVRLNPWHAFCSSPRALSQRTALTELMVEGQGSILRVRKEAASKDRVFQEERLAPGGLRNRGNPRGPYAGRQ
jgi:hypothetical protein